MIYTKLFPGLVAVTLAAAIALALVVIYADRAYELYALFTAQFGG